MAFAYATSQRTNRFTCTLLVLLECCWFSRCLTPRPNMHATNLLMPPRNSAPFHLHPPPGAVAPRKPRCSWPEAATASASCRRCDT
ncbi:hypothetical protein PF005_g9111 [Phytophthora fragariae]|uniref:Secreted protein n=1 Tax=Phytophthora fragariae TaxID=53985 RepID=A0A6A3UC82_9STRA|nr:hypothetical protein PF003_g6778 [Phytophthora fragariae]KAE8939447.1 hypothetical protein PF009_g10705 [Phytophthora fragariae]KAE9116235.1 hypothetical protein PF007_g9736 [Phytophthora fragariae]KAE9118125.1 hypothetical protein PF010_g8335 [Phytophthora fragariae]KAE9147998.1 hypothetical protein PF006_g7373 [Phytophthora fragariae]